MNWVEINKNREAIKAINHIVRVIAEHTDYDNHEEVAISSAIVRSLHKVREELFWEGLINVMSKRYECVGYRRVE